MPYFLFANYRHKRNCRHVPEPSDLDKGEDYELSEGGKIDRSIFDNQSRYADCGCRREYSIYKAELSVMCKRK